MKVDIDGYFFSEGNDGTLFLMIAEEDYDIVFDYIKEKQIKNIMLSEIGGNSGEYLDFLAEDYKFEKIHIFFNQSFDYSKLYYQTDLKELTVENRYCDIDYNRFPELQSLSIYGQRKIFPTFNKGNKLQRLTINDFHNTDLAFLQHCIHLQHLELYNGRRLTSLSGLNNEFTSLEQITFDYLPKLSDVEAFGNLPALKNLSIDHCPALKDVSMLQQVNTLESIVLLGYRQLTSVSFMDRMPALKEVFLDAKKIQDGYIPAMVK